MPPRSKWQSLPTEAINPSSLDLDQFGPDQLVDLMLTEDRKMLTAVQHERGRVAVGVEMIADALRKGGESCLSVRVPAAASAFSNRPKCR
jgi:N-acetylmuramic acid 6-phosphate (MurNAc-6-P) etherase